MFCSHTCFSDTVFLDIYVWYLLLSCFDFLNVNKWLFGSVIWVMVTCIEKLLSCWYYSTDMCAAVRLFMYVAVKLCFSN